MAKVITQATFDDVVKENMVEFEMSVEEAVNDTVEQFQSQVRQKKSNLDTYINTVAGYVDRK